MPRAFVPRCPTPVGLVLPVPVDREGVVGPTVGQARGPRWRRSSPRLYVPSTAPACVEQRILEQAQRLPPGGAVGGWAALRLAGAAYFDGLDADGAELPVRLVVPRGVRVRPLPGSYVERTVLDPEEVVVRHGVPCVHAVRALFDCARRLPVRDAVVCLDMALAADVVRLDALTAYVEGHRHRDGGHRLGGVMRLADARSRSPEETRLRLVWMLDAGLPRPLCNWPVADADGRRIGKPDLLCPELAVAGEYNGAEHRSRRRQASDAAREEGFRNVGLECFQVVGGDRHDTAKVVARMHAAVDRARHSSIPRTWMLQQDPGPA